MAIVRWKPGHWGWQRDPFAEMYRLQREMDRIYDSVLGRRGAVPSAGVFPALNISEDQDNLYVRAELPGIAPDELEITTKENNLIIVGERRFLRKRKRCLTTAKSESRAAFGELSRCRHRWMLRRSRHNVKTGYSP